MPFSGISSLAQLLKLRPAAVGLLEASGSSFWNRLDISVELFCHEAGLDPVAWIERVLKLPVSDEGSDWRAEPLYRIADFLTAEHRGFRERDLPDIDRLYGNISVHDGDFLSRPNHAFKYFEEGFLEHLHEEEERIFPYILRLEACTRIPGLKPVVNRVSFSLIAVRQGHAIREKQDQMRHTAGTGMGKAGNRLHVVLDDFENRLARHTGIETEVFFPRAIEIEKHLVECQGQDRGFLAIKA